MRWFPLVAFLSVGACEDWNGSNCPGRQHRCGIFFESPDACGAYEPTTLEVTYVQVQGLPTYAAWFAPDGRCVVTTHYYSVEQPPGYDRGDDWCTPALLDDHVRCDQ